MGKIISNFFISLDGVVERPDQWHFPYFNDEMGEIVGRGMEEQEAFLMGRVLYSEWSEYWTQQGPEVPFSSFINEIPKNVVSNTLTEASWNNTKLISGDVAAGIKQLKEETPGGIGMSGSATTVRWLLANGLLDELRLLVHPVAVGKGQRLFEDTPTHSLKLLDQETLSTGVLYLAYGPA
jgi:dihydrofolate reductase